MSPWANFIHIHRLLLALYEFGFNSEEMFDEDDAGHVADRAGPAPNLLIHRAVAFERGVDADDIKRRVARGDWQVLRRGVYARNRRNAPQEKNPPPPELQFRVLDRWGNVIARTDFFRWREFNTVGEFDGAAKYGRGLLDGRQPGDAVFQEKLREDGIRELGLTVVRWTWDELDNPRALADKIGRALTRGRALAVAGPS